MRLLTAIVEHFNDTENENFIAENYFYQVYKGIKLQLQMGKQLKQFAILLSFKLKNRQNLLMGSFVSSNKILEKGKEFKENLYERVNFFKIKHINQFSQIPETLKKEVIVKCATELVKMLQDNKITSQKLVLIFSERCCTIGLQNNYIFDEMFEQALQQATLCDQKRVQHPLKKNWKGENQYNFNQCFPPFYGIPASYKENIRLKNRESHAGYIIPHQKNYPPKQNGIFAEMTIRMGFIPFVRTNVPMSMKTIQTNNNMFGYAKNPWNQERSCGGSSGGQGGLIGSYCSPIGFGTDIAASLRIPAQWNGLTTLKPGNRYSKNGNCFAGKIAGGSPIKGELAPITRSVSDIILFMKFICNQKNYQGISKSIMDPQLNLKPFSDNIFIQKPKLKIGYIVNIDTIRSSPSHVRSVKQAVQTLKNKGHTVIKIQLPQLLEMYFRVVQIYVADGTMKSFTQISFGQPLIRQFNTVSFFSKLPNCIKSCLSWYLHKKDPRVSKIIDNSKKLSVSQTFAKIYEMQNQVSSQIYKCFIQNQIDALITPGYAFPASKLGDMAKLQYVWGFALTAWNVMNYPCGVVPMNVVQKDQQFYEDQFNDSVTKTIKNNMETSRGLPVGVQVVSLPFKEQLVTYIMSILEKQAKFREKYPCKKALIKKAI